MWRGTRPARAVLCVTAALLAACASQPATRWHTLLPAALGPSAGADVAPRAAAPVPYVLAPFRLPAQVDAPQWLVRQADDTVTVLEQDRWASPLRDELRVALVAALASGSNAQEAFGAAPAGGTPPPRVVVEWRRFESLLGREARQEGSFALQPASGSGPRCDFLHREPAPGGIDALAEGHRRIVARLAGEIGQALRDGRCSGAATERR